MLASAAISQAARSRVSICEIPNCGVESPVVTVEFLVEVELVRKGGWHGPQITHVMPSPSVLGIPRTIVPSVDLQHQETHISELAARVFHT